MKENYNWWTDPKNAEKAYQYSWWEHPENKDTYQFPISIIKDGKYFVVSGNSETKQLIGDIGNAAQGETKEEAIKKFFLLIRYAYDFQEESRLKFQRWVPFRKGSNWFSIFGIHFYFRYGRQNKYGWFVPFTKLNVFISSDWSAYKRYKKEQKLNNKQE